MNSRRAQFALVGVGCWLVFSPVMSYAVPLADLFQGQTITADDKSKVYGDILPTLTASYVGFVNGDTPASLDTPVTLATTATASSDVGGYVITKNFVRRRLRFVDAVHRPSAPVVAGAVAAAALLPVTVLPAVGVGTMLALGVGVAGGVASGRNAPPETPQ